MTDYAPDPGPAPSARGETLGSEPDRGWDDYDDLLAGIGAERSAPDSTALIECKDVTIGELTRLLEGLRPLGDLAAAAEQARLAAVARAEAIEARVAALEGRLSECEGELEVREEDRAQLERLSQQREQVLERERERHDRTRKKLAERQAVAAERWKELRALRSKLKQLERDGDGPAAA